MLRIHRLRVKRRNVARRTACQTHLCQPEVKNLGVAAFGDEDVGGLDVTMHNAFAVSCIQCVRNLDGE